MNRTTDSTLCRQALASLFCLFAIGTATAAAFTPYHTPTNSTTNTQAPAEKDLLPMGFNSSWKARIMFNPEGGYNGQFNNTPNPIHGWERMYEAKTGDTYTITLPTAAQSTNNAQVQFRTPITLVASHKYQIRASLSSTRNVDKVRLTVSEGQNDDIKLGTVEHALTAGVAKGFIMSGLTGKDISEAKLDFRFHTSADNTVIRISSVRIYDQTEGRELWIGTSYFNWCYYADPRTNTRIKDMQIEGRTETLSWASADNDDSMWQEADMPIGNDGYMAEVKTVWPGNDNTCLWIRRDFTLDKVNGTSKYVLKVCHDDCYSLYVNGHLLHSASDWTNGKDYIRVPLPARYLRQGSNVIAACVQQNWGGRFYDCGLAETENYYEDYDTDADPSALVINEIEVRNVDRYLDWSFNYGSWIELYNPTDKRVPLSGLWLGTDPANARQYQLRQEHGVVPAHGYRVLYFGHHASQGTYGDTADRQVPLKLSNDGGHVALADNDGNVISAADYPTPISRCSYARTTDGGTQWGTTGQPTPSATNATSAFASQRASAPQPDTDSRLFTTPFTMHVPIPEGCRLMYTTDGSSPGAEHGTESTDGVFNISQTTVLRLALLDDGCLPSMVVTRSYIYRDHDYYLPVMCISTAADNLYGDSIGVYVDGKNGVAGRNHGKSNINMDWERPVNVEYMTSDGRMALNMEAEFKVAGGWSRHFAPSSFKIKASKTYEEQKSLNAEFFSPKPYNKYKQLLVRNGGNDNEGKQHGRVRDAITQEVLMGSGFYVDAQAYQPIHVFMNGKYLAQMNLREPGNRYHGTANYGYDDDAMDAFEYSNGYAQTSGTRDAFDRWLELSAQATDSATYAELCQLVDMDEYTNYWAAVAYIGCSDWICNSNNVKGYRSLPDGKFHLVMIDQDFGWTNVNALSLLDGNTTNELTCIYNNIKQNATWQRKFVDAYCLAGGSVFTPERCRMVGDSICSLVGKALDMEGREPTLSFREQRANMVGEAARKAKMDDLRKNYHLGTGMEVTFGANTPEAAFRLNGQHVPLGSFSGTLFAPVRIEASAAAGYNFEGWKRTDTGEWVSHDRTLALDKDTDMSLQAVFRPLKAAALADAGSTPVVINEVSAKNSIFQNDLFKRADWVELYNTTSHDIDLQGMFLTNNPAQPEQYTITPATGTDGSTIIPAHGYKVIWMDKTQGESQLHASFKLKDDDGSSITLTASDHSWADTLVYKSHSGEQSVGRYPDGGKRVYKMDKPTIGAANWISDCAEWQSGTDQDFDDSAYATAIYLPGRDVPGEQVEYYSLQGTRLAAPQRGVVIVRKKLNNGEVQTYKMLVR